MYAYAHFPMIVGIVLFAFAMKTIVGHVGDELDSVAAFALCGGSALYLLTYSAIRIRIERRLAAEPRPLRRARSLLLLLLPLATVVPALAALALVTAVWLALHAYELVLVARGARGVALGARLTRFVVTLRARVRAATKGRAGTTGRSSVLPYRAGGATRVRINSGARAAAHPARSSARYLVLLLGNTLAASLIWGINTIFLLDAGLSNLEAFAANAFFTAGMVLFEVPTGVVADTVGRRASYLLGTVTLAVSTLLYVLLWQIEAPFWAWAVVVDPARARVHVLLRRGRGVARRRAARHRLHGRARVGVRPRPGRRRASRCSTARSPAASSPRQTNLGVPFVLRGGVLVVMFARRVRG